MSDDRTFVITPSRFQWHKAKDYFHLYFMLGAIPVGIMITLVNVFIGPATLEEIPKDYVPKEWEYLQVKIFTRWGKNIFFFLFIFEYFDRLLETTIEKCNNLFVCFSIRLKDSCNATSFRRSSRNTRSICTTYITKISSGGSGFSNSR